MTHYGAIEAGGTKFVLAVGDDQFNLLEKLSIPTRKPEETLEEVVAFFKEHPIDALGLGSFGPIDLNKDSETYGWITNTPKLAWQMFDVVGYLEKALKVPVIPTTDVNAACYGEYRFGVAKGKKSAVYYTVGTGIGAGAINQGQFISGLSHPEMGHMKVVPHPDDDFQGACPFHGNCLEGMASGPAIEKRTGKKGDQLSVDDPTWDFVSDYLAQAIYNTALMLDPEVIIFGGGVMKQTHVLNKVRTLVTQYMNGYKELPALTDYIKLASLNDNQGVLGCFALANEYLENKKVLESKVN
ncbi:MAG: ROK family protein [Bavariicoccus seileri]|uniref:ROK family protein n=1 Tax=Bavariicoccus seileri TaxID=549685 RepID=UPI003F9A3C1A